MGSHDTDIGSRILAAQHFSLKNLLDVVHSYVLNALVTQITVLLCNWLPACAALCEEGWGGP